MSSESTLPDDILHIIIDYHLESILSEQKPVRDYRRRRGLWQAEVVPLARCSKQFWRLVMPKWGMLWAACDREILSPGVQYVLSDVQPYDYDI